MPKLKRKTTKIEFRTSEEFKILLKEQAEKENITVTKLIENAIEDYLENNYSSL